MVTVVGAGVSGLTTAVVLCRAGLEVEVVTDRASDDLVSWVAAAIWTIPDLAAEEPRASWATRSREVFAALAAVPDSGVSPLHQRNLYRRDPGPVRWECMPWIERLDPPTGYAVALGIDGFVIDPRVYLPWLRSEFERLGGEVVERHLVTLDDVAGDVVNASGLGARRLVGDGDLYPIRGQVVAVTAPIVTEGFSDESEPDRIAYGWPRPTEVVLGGTRERGVDDRSVDAAETVRILADTARLDPRLADAPVVEVRVGLRPGRDAVRLERDDTGDRVVVHNYGHAGQGYLLSWGCADAVLDLLEG